VNEEALAQWGAVAPKTNKQTKLHKFINYCQETEGYGLFAHGRQFVLLKVKQSRYRPGVAQRVPGS